MSLCLCFFFFQAEDGIRDHCVTGVQTCALPISEVRWKAADILGQLGVAGLRAELSQDVGGLPADFRGFPVAGVSRSEERRVGKECRSRWCQSHEKNKRERKEHRSITRRAPARPQ